MKEAKGCLIGVCIVVLFGIIGSLLPESDNEIYAEAKSKYQSGDYENALSVINEVISKDSTNADYYELRGMILYELQDTVQSEEDFQKTLHLSQTDSAKDIKIRELIEWDLKHGEEDKARELLNKEIELYKNDSLKHIEVVEYAIRKYLAFGDTLETIKLYQLLTEEYPSNSMFENQLGILYTNIGNYKKAIREFKEAVELEPENDTYLYNLGASYLSIKNKTKAKVYFKKSAELGNKEACNHYRELTARTKYYTRSKCCDGTTSSSVGRGTCSHHGGVCGTESIPYKEYTINCR